MKSFRLFSAILLFSASISPALAQEFNRDLSIDRTAGVQSVDYLLVGRQTRLYVTVQNHSQNEDLYGVVKFFDEKAGKFIGQDQPVSALAGKTDDVFVDWTAPKEVGEVVISARVIPWNPEGNNPENDKTSKTLYVDWDPDKDGLGNRQDEDDDNDGVNDAEDAFPFEPAESLDTDADGLGDNADPDDDNDGVNDAEDAFPTDSAETSDSDGDGAGDNADLFPSDSLESLDTDADGLGDNADPDDSNKGPVAKLHTPENVVTAGKQVSFDASRSTDSDGDIVSYSWNFGDGSTQEGVNVTHVFEKSGVYPVTLSVTDEKGESRMQTINVTVVKAWQTIALGILALLLFLALIAHLLFGRKSLKEEGPLPVPSDSSPQKARKADKGKKSLPKKKK